ARHTSFGGNVLEFPVAEISIKHIVAIEPAKIEVTKTITIDITGRDPRTAEQNPIGDRARLGQSIGEQNSRGRALLPREPCATSFGDRKFRPLETVFLMPRQCFGSVANQDAKESDYDEQC